MKLRQASRIRFHPILQRLVWFLPTAATLVKLMESKEGFQEALAAAGDES